MGKKLVIILMMIICCFAFSNVRAESLSDFMDIQAYNEIYRLSEDSDISLPFVKVFNDKAFLDKGLNKSGISIGSKSIEIGERVSGIQLIVSTDTVDIKGTMEYAIIMAPNVVISGNVEKDIIVMGESLFITETANIAGDIIAVSEKIEIRGNILGNFIGKASNLLVQGNIEKDLRVSSESIEFTDNNINGNIYIETDTELNISEKYPNAIVKKITNDTIQKEARKDAIKEKILDIVIGVLAFVVFKLIITAIRPNVFKNLKDKFIAHSSYGIIAGVIGIGTIPIILTILALLSMFGLSVVTMPIFVAYIAVVVVAIALAKFIVGTVFYEYLKEKININSKVKSIGVLALIYALVYLICNLPYIGYFITMASILLSSGIIITGFTRKINKE